MATDGDLGDAAVDLTRELVGIDSVNPGLVPGAAGETRIAGLVADRLDAAGFDVSLVAPPHAPDRPSVLAILGDDAGPTVVLNGHLDTVGVDGMGDPFTARVDGDRMYGRGTCDMKAGVAGQVVAAERLAALGPPGRLVVAQVADEEDASLGTEAVLAELARRGVTGDVCVVGEPTGLDLAVAHRGYAVIRVRLTGRAAHTSQPEAGVDAVAHLGRLLVAVTAQGRRLARTGMRHPLLGAGSLQASVVTGGRAPFTVAARAEALVERRTLPGEPGEQALAEVRAILAEIGQQDPRVGTDAEILLARDAWEAHGDGAAAALMDLLAESLAGLRDGPPARVGAPYWMESALWQGAGVPAVVVGPAGAGLHAVDEWVSVAQVRAYPVALVAAILRLSGGGASPAPGG